MNKYSFNTRVHNSNTHWSLFGDCITEPNKNSKTEMDFVVETGSKNMKDNNFKNCEPSRSPYLLLVGTLLMFTSSCTGTVYERKSPCVSIDSENPYAINPCTRKPLNYDVAISLPKKTMP